MNYSQKKVEVADRIEKLSQLRAELAVARSELNKDLQKVSLAGYYYRNEVPSFSRPPRSFPTDKPENWPSSEDIASQENTVATFKSEADTILGELKDLGVDIDLFRINGG